MRGQAAAAYGAHAANVPDEEVQAQLQTLLEDEGVWTKRHGQTLALNSVIKHLHRNGRDAPAGAAIEAIMEKLKALAKDDRVPVREALAAVCGNALRVMLTLGNQVTRSHLASCGGDMCGRLTRGAGLAGGDREGAVEAAERAGRGPSGGGQGRGAQGRQGRVARRGARQDGGPGRRGRHGCLSGRSTSFLNCACRCRHARAEGVCRAKRVLKRGLARSEYCRGDLVRSEY